MAQSGVFDQLDDAAGLGQVAGQRLFADHALQFGAGAGGRDDLFDHLDAGEIGREQRDHVDVGRHLGDAREDAAFTQIVRAHERGQLFRRPPRDQPRDLDAAHLLQRPKLKRRDKPAADNSISQRLHLEFANQGSGAVIEVGFEVLTQDTGKKR